MHKTHFGDDRAKLHIGAHQQHEDLDNCEELRADGLVLRDGYIPRGGELSARQQGALAEYFAYRAHP